MDAGYFRSLVQSFRRPHSNNLYSNKVNQLTWVCAVRSWVVCAFVAILWTQTSVAQTTSPKAIDSDPRFQVSLAELKVPNRVWSRLQAAHKAINAGNLQEAAKQSDEALQIDPECAAAFSMKALIELARNKPLDAMQNAIRATYVDPHYVEGFVVLAMVGNAADDFANSQHAAEQALTLEPGSWKAHLELAKSFYGEAWFNAALLELNQVRKDFPDVHLVRGNILMRLGRNDESAQEFALFLREAPYDPRAAVIRQIIALTAGSPGPHAY